MDRRPELGQLLRKILGSSNVYFQPPGTVKMGYPAIKYERTSMDTDYADDTVYRRRIRYSITVIDSDPDSEITTRVSMLPYCKFDRHYVQDNLNHDVFEILY